MSPRNFGRNVAIEPKLLVVPKDRKEVLAVLEQHRGRKIRVIGSLHSWSEAARADDVAVDVRHLAGISLVTGAEHRPAYADIGAGCTVDRALDYLHQRGYTLPVYGVVGQQTIAGAISTATHGSGRSSMSHYVMAVTLAGYDGASGAPRIFEWTGGDALRAGRCGLGCTGVLLSVRMRVEPECRIEERGQWFDRLDELLAVAEDYPRHQFYLMPWSWKWYAQLRREIADGTARFPSTIVAHALRAFRLVVIDVGLNGAIRAATATPRARRMVPWIFHRVLPLLAPSGVRVIDRSRKLLMMRHDLYAHVECELFVPASHLGHAAAFVEWVLACCGGEARPLPEHLAADDFGCDVTHDIDSLRGLYLHDYPLTCRRVLRDDTLISMTSGDEEKMWYAISLITYQRELAPFLRMARFLAVTMAHAYRARPHWGKICPLNGDELSALYPGLRRFRAQCESVDPSHTFVNDFAGQALGFEQSHRKELREEP
jgi:FAD/FMN-containing dehydrogenase